MVILLRTIRSAADAGRAIDAERAGSLSELEFTEPQPHRLALARVAMPFAQKSRAALIALVTP
jgi:hypothetical protein